MHGAQLVRKIQRPGRDLSFCALDLLGAEGRGFARPRPALISVPGAVRWPSSSVHWWKPTRTRGPFQARAASAALPARSYRLTHPACSFSTASVVSGRWTRICGVLNGGQKTPAPWVNVIANSNFGFQVSAEGAGFCWAVNSQQNQITPWSNDPVSNEPSEVLYLQGSRQREMSGRRPPSPIADPAARYTVRHGQGYSGFEYTGRELLVELTQFVPSERSFKDHARSKSRTCPAGPGVSLLSAYAEWALGQSRAAARPTSSRSLTVRRALCLHAIPTVTISLGA